MTQYQALLVDLVTQMQGCKATELLVRPELFSIQQPEKEWYEILESCIEEGLLIGVEYCLPSMPERQKEFLLPANTSVHILGTESITIPFPPKSWNKP